MRKSKKKRPFLYRIWKYLQVTATEVIKRESEFLSGFICIHSRSCKIDNQKNWIPIFISFSALVFMFVMFHQSSRSQIAYFRASHVESRASTTVSTDHNQKFESKHRLHLHGDQETVLEFQVWVSLWSRQPRGVPQHVLKILPDWWWAGGRCKIWSTFKLFNTSANLSSYSDYIFYAMDHQKTGTINFEVKTYSDQ